MQQMQQNQMLNMEDIEEPDFDPEDYQEDIDIPTRVAPELSLVDKIINEVREPLIVIMCFIIFNLPMLDNIGSKYVKKAYNELGRPNIIGLMVKALLVGIIFYLIKKFI